MPLKRPLTLAIALAVSAAAACTPVTRRHGYAPEADPLTEIQVNIDTVDTVRARYGNPSTASVFDGDVWYYVTDVRTQLAYLRPESSARSITAVHFDGAGVVSSVETYGLENGRVVALVDRKTPTRGRELTILEQLLGTVGRLPTETLSDEQNLPGGAGGPTGGGF